MGLILIGGSGMAAGKDTVAAMIQYVLNGHHKDCDLIDFIESSVQRRNEVTKTGDWTVQSYAHKIKVHVANMLNVPVEQMEDKEWIEQELGEEWEYDADLIDPRNGVKVGTFKTRHTPRSLMQQVGTEVCRIIHPDYWANGLYVDYVNEPNWIVKDWRYDNEATYPKRKGLEQLIIYVERDDILEANHASDRNTSKSMADEVLDNNGTIQELYGKVIDMLQRRGFVD
jgi:hypothetical protein